MFDFIFFPFKQKNQALRKDKPLMKDFQTPHILLFFLPPSICWKGELKYEDGRCSTSSENCNFCSPALLADRRYFISVVTDVLIKHQEQSAVPVSFSFPYKHTYTHIYAHKMCTACANIYKKERGRVLFASTHQHNFLHNHTPASALKISCCI